MSSARLISTAEGTTQAHFAARDWAEVGLISLIWGSSYLWIDIGVDSFAPLTVTLLRLAFGFAVLSLLPAARARIEREDRARLLLLSVVWQVIPLSLYPIAEQWISSSVAGMLNGALPVLIAVVASVLLRRPPGRNQQIGMALGLFGVVLISIPTWEAGPRLALGSALVLGALVCYAFASNMSVPLTHRYGSIAVQWAMQRTSLLFVAPLGLWGLRDSRFDWGGVGAVAVLGVVGTGVAFLLAGRVYARVGATRGAAFNYIIPVVSIALGVVVRHDQIAPLALAGTALVLLGAVFCSRAGR